MSKREAGVQSLVGSRRGWEGDSDGLRVDESDVLRWLGDLVTDDKLEIESYLLTNPPTRLPLGLLGPRGPAPDLVDPTSVA